MPTLIRAYEHDGRVSAVRTTNGDELAKVHYRDGYVHKLELGMTASLQLSKPKNGRVTQTLRGRGDLKIREVVAPGRERYRESPFVLDLVAKDLGLGDDWRNKVRAERSASRHVTTICDLQGRMLLFLVHVGTDVVAFRVDGEPLFYDVLLEVSKSAAEPGTDLVIDFPSIEMSAVTPDRFVLGCGGTTEAYVSSFAEGAINSFWTDVDANGHEHVRHRIIDRVRTEDADSKTVPSRGIAPRVSYSAESDPSNPRVEAQGFCLLIDKDTTCDWSEYTHTDMYDHRRLVVP
ncbi:MAG: hypothetical protein ACYC9N_22455 [Thermoanaerobaculia bacterium]